MINRCGTSDAIYYHDVSRFESVQLSLQHAGVKMNQSYVMPTCASRTVSFRIYATASDCMMKDLQNMGHDFDSHRQNVHQTQRKQNISHSFYMFMHLKEPVSQTSDTVLAR